MVWVWDLPFRQGLIWGLDSQPTPVKSQHNLGQHTQDKARLQKCSGEARVWEPQYPKGADAGQSRSHWDGAGWRQVEFQISKPDKRNSRAAAQSGWVPTVCQVFGDMGTMPLTQVPWVQSPLPAYLPHPAIMLSSISQPDIINLLYDEGSWGGWYPKWKAFLQRYGVIIRKLWCKPGKQGTPSPVPGESWGCLSL